MNADQPRAARRESLLHVARQGAIHERIDTLHDEAPPVACRLNDPSPICCRADVATMPGRAMLETTIAGPGKDARGSAPLVDELQAGFTTAVPAARYEPSHAYPRVGIDQHGGGSK